MHIKHEENPWSKLYLPQGFQEMIQSLVAQQIRMDAEPLTDRQDLVRGKGRQTSYYPWTLNFGLGLGRFIDPHKL